MDKFKKIKEQKIKAVERQKKKFKKRKIPKKLPTTRVKINAENYIKSIERDQLQLLEKQKEIQRENLLRLISHLLIEGSRKKLDKKTVEKIYKDLNLESLIPVIEDVEESEEVKSAIKKAVEKEQEEEEKEQKVLSKDKEKKQKDISSKMEQILDGLQQTKNKDLISNSLKQLSFLLDEEPKIVKSFAEFNQIRSILRNKYFEFTGNKARGNIKNRTLIQTYLNNL